MTAHVVPPTDLDGRGAPPDAASHRPRAVAVRRWFIILSPVLAGLFAIVGAASDPAVGIDGREMYAIYAEQPGPLQLKSLGLHWAFAFWAAPALLLAGYVRGRGAWLANIAAFLGFVGISTLPGLLFVDYYDSAIGQLYGADGAVAVSEQMETMWGVPVFAAPAVPGVFLGFLLAIIALWRAGLVRWWAVVAVVAGYVAFGGVTWWGSLLMTLCFGVVAVALERATRAGGPGSN